MSIPTRWRDNDIYGHVNNIEYYSFFDSRINLYLIEFGGLNMHTGAQMGLCAESHCKFLAELTFPETVECGLRVDHVGTSSVRYGLGLFRAGHSVAAAEGWFVQVFVDRATRRASPLTPVMRAALETIRIAGQS